MSPTVLIDQEDARERQIERGRERVGLLLGTYLSKDICHVVRYDNVRMLNAQV